MKNRLPVNIENRELPIDEDRNIDREKKTSYGYVSVLYLASLIITIISLLSVMMMWSR